ncbi:MAG: xanthine dehydrogenase small subunit [Planctomycetota bacterium]
MSEAFSFCLNGTQVSVAGVDPNTTLLAWLRRRGLTGTKESCAEGECGACAVAVVVARLDGRSAYQTVNSCLVLLPDVAGGEVWTVEGVGGASGLHPVQEMMVAHGGSQCGYCTPGFVMSLFAYYYAEPRPAATTALAGNLCRCTGYRPILDGASELPRPAASDEFLRRLARAAPAPAPLRYAAGAARFDRPTELVEALALRAAYPEATILQGGTDLAVTHNQERAQFPHLIALGAVPELRAIEATADHVWIGAGVTWAEAEEQLGDRVAMFAELARLFASPLIRARATVGGNLMTASPVGDAAPVLLALDAEVELASASAKRMVPLDGFFTGYRRTLLRPDELLTAVRLPAVAPTASRFYKVSKRELDDISSVSAAVAVWLERGRIARVRLAFGGVAATPVRATAAETELVGRRLDAEALRNGQRALAASFQPISDVRASAAYRAAMLPSLLAKFWADCGGAVTS